MANARTAEQETAWQSVRSAVAARDEGRCRDCGQGDDYKNLDVHHLVPRSLSGPDDIANCVLLCDGCHAARHPNLQMGLARRAVERWAIRLAKALDKTGDVPDNVEALRAGLSLLGVDHLREGQLEVILAALRGESTLVVRPTGSGKSLCFQLPALLGGRPGALVLCPTKALMADQISDLLRRKLPASFVNADISAEEKRTRLELYERDALAMLYCTPERLDRKRVRDASDVARLTRRRPSILVVDEAHVITGWGDDFRPAYGRLKEVRSALGDPPVMALTATAGVSTQRRILESLGIEDARVFVAEADRPNISLYRVAANEGQRADEIVKLVRAMRSGRALIFVPTTNKGRKVLDLLAQRGLDMPLFHGQLPAPERAMLQGRLTGALEPELRAVICTSAFSMGIDVPDIRLVVHWQHPASVENYLQEFGRAGRDGREALAVCFTGGATESGLHEWMANLNVDEALANGTLSPEEAARVRGAKLEAIDILRILVHSENRCYRAGVIEALVGRPQARRRPPAIRLLDWVFGRRTKIDPTAHCCDVCAPMLDLAAHPALSLHPAAGRTLSREPTEGLSGHGASGSHETDRPAGEAAHANLHAPTTSRPSDGANGVEAAVLSLLAELGEPISRGWASHLLIGTRGPKTLERGFDRLPSFGSCDAQDRANVVAQLDQLVAIGKLTLTDGERGRLQLPGMSTPEAGSPS